MPIITPAHAVFARLWEAYRERVTYVRQYEEVIAAAGATFANDHIAFRTFAWQRPTAGIASIARPFQALGYQPAGCYEFPDKHLSAIHLSPILPDLPKLFVSELKTWELSETAREIIGRSLAQHREPLDDSLLASLFATGGDSGTEALARHLLERPWPPPERADVEALEQESQYAAWVLVHGYAVNHFTALINSHAVAALDSIEKTVEAMKAAGVPMKAEIEGLPGSKLRQTATEAVVIDVDVLDDGRPATMPWTYAYFELAERGEVVDRESGESTRFEGFLGAQATQLFEMTRKT